MSNQSPFKWETIPFRGQTGRLLGEILIIKQKKQITGRRRFLIKQAVCPGME